MAVVFITGPVRSGKSAFGVRLARESGREVTYVATAGGAPEDV
ncbi:MAG TPA: bifunctional adenosylcobinamide kinase/adenosylcobinamide-phosphate guanylyltransferase, partial [Candidatus Dormibacteraeota bacterium]|nr:bifunctional adenosylcobinamide kinase/adenosylcobinamide-phosphate guanylyltransferase [Candidatus Dormibacteraeota bacterium]